MAPLQFGALMIPYQTIDAIGPLDILSSASKKLIAAFEEADLPGMKGMTAKAIDIEFHHINETLEPVTLTANVRLLPSTTCDTCPALDFLLVGGPDPLAYKLSPRFAEFIRQHVAEGKVLFTTCTGALAVAASGVLDGKNATVNHAFVEMAKKMAPVVKWQKRQWVVDGNIWTAGGACAGMDMFASWVMTNYGMDIARFVFGALDFEPRDVEGALVLPRQHGVKSA
ncbi:Isonitrile hydratase [Lachnellula occidentalis]|uniref:Isonitrile hydratase n=1 Tax=Lachnellula occidentalis TaxID=215460 RepID=A0A8H8RKD2_9HELO|nr:Isonitrile hydratase [Lachnellula occidentalis]